MALANHGNVYYKNKRYQEALADLNRAREFQPENYWILMHRAMTNLALNEFGLAGAFEQEVTVLN